MSKGGSTKRSAQGLMKLLTLISLLAPLLVLVAVFGTRFGLWSLSLGLETLTFAIGGKLALVGGVAALGVVALGLRQWRAVWPLMLVAVVSAVASLTLYKVQAPRYNVPGAADVTTNAVEPPPFSKAVLAERGGVETTAEPCDGLVSVARQVAPETAAYAMREAGFTVRGVAPFRADGHRESFWFGQVHDVAIRIRPGQTDVRVAARYPAKDGDQACTLAKAVVKGLQPFDN